MNKVTKKDVLSASEEEQFGKIIEYCATNNPDVFNFNKALEEFNEFSEVLLKLQTKHPDNPKRPKPEDAVGEYGDSIYRGFIALLTLFPDKSTEDVVDMIIDHIENKLGKLIGWLKEGKYKGGL